MNSLITLSGVDGSGKSLLAKEIVCYLEARGYNCCSLHAHAYSISKSSGGLTAKQVHKYRFILMLALPFLYLDNLYTYFFDYKKRLRNSPLVLDRYFYDKVARAMFYGIIGKSFASLYLSILPRPTVAFYLDVDPNDAFLRKGEYTLKEYKKFRDIYRYIACKTNSIIVNTSLTPKESLSIIYLELERALGAQ